MNDNEFQMSSPMTPLQASNMPGEYSFFSFEEVRREETNQRLNYDPEVKLFIYQFLKIAEATVDG
jgi:hypothetical protein